MLSEKMFEGLNDQMMYEFASGHYYLAMAAYCKSIDLDGFANFFIVQEAEERMHAMKFFEYIDNREGDIKMTEIFAPKTDYKSLEDVFEVALNHEKGVTKRINNLMDIAIKDNDHATQSFLRWFIDEQVEEEASMLAILKKLRFVGDNKQGLFLLDREIGQRKE